MICISVNLILRGIVMADFNDGVNTLETVRFEKTVPVVFATNENYAPYAGVAICSMLENSSEKNFYDVYVFHTGLSDKTTENFEKLSRKNCRVTCLDGNSYIDAEIPLYENFHFSKEMYYRILIPTILPQYDKVIYLDSDTVILGDIDELFDTDTEGCAVCGVNDVMHSVSKEYVKNVLGLNPDRYINSGVLIIDCKRFKELEINVDPKTIMSTMPVSQRQMVEIAKAVSYNSKIIVFDEPTSSLTEEEAEHLFRIINMLRDRGCAIIYISHKMEEILRISDEVTIMCDGRWVATKPASELTMNEIIRLMVGRELTNRYPKKDNEIGDVLLKVENLGSEYTNLRDVSFEANRGEILGVAGLDGSGRTELLEQIFGITTRRSGKIFLDGKEVKNKTPHESIKNGFALLTEERRATGIFGILNIRENATVASLKKYMTGPFVSKKKMKVTTDKYINSLKIKTPSQETKISSLSGGNQQKVIFARWLLTDPTVLLLDEPTRGIDVGAKYEIYQLILDLAKKGKTVIMVSSEMPELLGVCDKILVMSGGRLAGEVDAGTTNQEEIMTLAAKYV